MVQWQVVKHTDSILDTHNFTTKEAVQIWHIEDSLHLGGRCARNQYIQVQAEVDLVRQLESLVHIMSRELKRGCWFHHWETISFRFLNSRVEKNKALLGFWKHLAPFLAMKPKPKLPGQILLCWVSIHQLSQVSPRMSKPKTTKLILSHKLPPN